MLGYFIFDIEQHLQLQHRDFPIRGHEVVKEHFKNTNGMSQQCRRRPA
jgi:hypothetical protein